MSMNFLTSNGQNKSKINTPSKFNNKIPKIKNRNKIGKDKMNKYRYQKMINRNLLKGHKKKGRNHKSI